MLRNVRRQEDGFALLTVIGSMAVVSLFLLSSLAYVLNSMSPSRGDQDTKAAVAAAQAGIDEYVARLNANDTYWTRGNVDCDNPALTPPTAGTCTTPRPSKGVPVPGTTDRATYKYRLLSTTASTTADGVIRLEVTGNSREKSRELVAELTPSGFLQYIYYTDFESNDPALSDAAPRADVNGVNFRQDTGSKTYKIWYTDQTLSDEFCRTKHWYEGRDDPKYTVGKYFEYSLPYDNNGNVNGPTTGPVERQASSSNVVSFGCGEIQFTGGDKITGPLKTNDAMLLTGSPWFTSRKTETAYTNPTNATRPWRGDGTPSTGTTSEPGFRPVTGTRLEMPDSNAELVNAATTTANGCVFTGATRIKFRSDGKMDVTSPATSGAVPRCYSGGSSQQTKNLPSVIYVQEATSCTSGVGYPNSNESLSRGANPDFDCKRGNAYVSGTVSGRVTIGTANDVVVVGDTTYKDGLTGTDTLGLIPQNNAWIYHPVKNDGSNLLGTPVTKVDAAILSVQHSFIVQNYNQGAEISSGGTNKLRVRGAIAQRFRGPVGTSGGGGRTGYLKDYSYDPRLLNAPPPYFLKPLTSPYAVTKVTD